MYALSFRREALSVLDVSFVAAECFPPRRRCAVEGALLEELLVTAFLAPLLDADLRALPHLQLFATDACVFGTVDPSLRFFRRERLFSEVGLGYEFDAPTGT